MFGYIKIAAAVPAVLVGNVSFNCQQIISKITEAKENGADLIVFPELCITGATCGDLFFQQVLLKDSLKALREITEHTEKEKAAVIVSAPVYMKNGLFNCAFMISNGTIYGAYVKTYLPNYGEFYEKRWFSSADALRVDSIFASELGFDEDYEIPIGNDLIYELNGEINIATEICEDMWAPVSVGTILATNGAEIIVNLSAASEAVGKRKARRNLVSTLSAKNLSGYVYVSAGEGESTTDSAFPGHSLICENGTVIAENAKLFDEDYILYGEIDIEKIKADRAKNKTFADLKGEFQPRYIFVETEEFKATGETLNIKKFPFVPCDAGRWEEILAIQVAGLKKRWKTIGGKAVIGVSGGLDSTVALLVTALCAKELNKPLCDVVGITMPAFGTTGRTYNNAVALIKNLGLTFEEINIKDACLKHFEDINHNENTYDLTYENAQARERTQVLMDYAGKVGGFVVGTGDLSELALGWCTYNGDHMSMYGVNCGIPKTLLRWMLEKIADSEMFEGCNEILRDIAETPISPELLPPDAKGEISQKTESLVGPYELSDFFLYYALRYAFSPEKIYHLAKKAFKDDYNEDEIYKWLENFYKRFFTQQFKRSCSPDGVKVGSIGISPRGDLKMPSDASYNIWLENLKEIKNK